MRASIRVIFLAFLLSNPCFFKVSRTGMDTDTRISPSEEKEESFFYTIEETMKGGDKVSLFQQYNLTLNSIRLNKTIANQMTTPYDESSPLLTRYRER
jgi:hypothetical protein